VIETLRTRENNYNSALSNLDKLYHEMLETERELSDMAEHMLLGVATRYGKSSVEYGMAGGVPKNQRRKGLRGEGSTSNSASPVFVASANGNDSPNGNPNSSKNGKKVTTAS
jgi:hypothetical protein